MNFSRPDTDTLAAINSEAISCCQTAANAPSPRPRTHVCMHTCTHARTRRPHCTSRALCIPLVALDPPAALIGDAVAVCSLHNLQRIPPTLACTTQEMKRYVTTQAGPLKVVLLGPGSPLFAHTAGRIRDQRNAAVYQLQPTGIINHMAVMPIWAADWQHFLGSWMSTDPLAFQAGLGGSVATWLSNPGSSLDAGAFETTQLCMCMCVSA